MSLQTDERCVLVVASEGHVCVSTHASRLTVVFDLINDGSIGSGMFGGASHQQALVKVEEEIARVRSQFTDEDKECR